MCSFLNFCKAQLLCENVNSTGVNFADIVSSSSPHTLAHVLPVCKGFSSIHEADISWRSKHASGTKLTAEVAKMMKPVFKELTVSRGKWLNIDISRIE